MQVTWLSVDPSVPLPPPQVKSHSCCKRRRWRSSTTPCATWWRRASSPPGCSAAASYPEGSTHARWDIQALPHFSHIQFSRCDTSAVIIRETRVDPWCASRRAGSGSRPASWAGARAVHAGTSRGFTRVLPSWESGSKIRRGFEEGRECRVGRNISVPK